AANEAVAFFPPLPEELVRLPKKEAVGLLQNAIRRESIQGRTLAVILRNERGDSKVCILKNPDDIDSLPLDNSTVFLPTHAGCLDPRGFPDPDSAEPVEDIADTDDRRRIFPDDPEAPIPKGWSQLRLNIQQDDENEAEPRWLLYRVSGKKTWHWDADSDLTSVAMNNQTLAEHHRRVGEVVRKMAERLNLEPEITKALGIAGENHDLGKRAKVWQKAAGISKNSPPMAKSQEGRFQPEVLGGYRHEFGSLMELERNLDSNTPLRDLILHLVAAHHGRGRPGFEDPRQWSQEFPEEANLEMAKAVAIRFGQVQGRWGPWRLAWMESLLKAADAAVSSWRDVGGERL
ncbi:MAG: HD domain-containing protein, partial [Magnetococcales bacterium]|nr:HD domain-containing protein [Magnetococcales bacterium]